MTSYQSEDPVVLKQEIHRLSEEHADPTRADGDARKLERFPNSGGGRHIWAEN
jgi:hypothetical protein